jgi:FkbM family methyltransferase
MVARALSERALVSLIAAVYHRFEPELTHLHDLCPSAGTAVDVGAWYGPWSRRLATRIDRVIACEPVPDLADRLARTMPGNVQVIPAAVSDRCGQATIWLPPDGAKTGRASLSEPYTGGSSRAVPMLTLDSLDLDHVRFIKIDVEGHEVPVLKGAQRTIEHDRPQLLVEAETELQPIDEIVNLVTDWGYRAWVLLDTNWVPLTEFDLETHQRQHPVSIAGRRLARRVLRPRPRYVQAVLFVPDPPGEPLGGTR